MADLAVTAANVVKGPNAAFNQGIAGVAITAGQILYLDPATNTLKLADANGVAATQVIAGVALNNAAANQPIVYDTLDAALVIGATLVSGDVIYLSATPGGFTKTVADLAGITATAIVLGVAVSTTAVNFRPIVGGALA